MPDTPPDTTALTLFHMASCPYCLHVRDVIDELGLDIPMRDTVRDPAARRELVAGGGRTQVPCLRIESREGGVRWLYESLDIERYLRNRFARSS